MATAAKILLTIGEIARRLNEPIHRVEYVIRSRAIAANSIAGTLRVFDEADLDRIANILRDIDDRRDGTATAAEASGQ